MDPEITRLQRLAEEHSLKTADQIKPPPPPPRDPGSGEGPSFEYVDETPRRPKRTRDEIDAEAELDHHWVVLIALERPAPRFFGDNRGMWPLHVERVADWRRSGVVYDHQQPALRAIRLSVIGVNSKDNAERLKSELDEALNGRQTATEAEPLRWRFRNGVDFGAVDIWWAPLMQDALMRCELAAANFEVFDRSGHERMVEQRARQIMDRRGRL